MWFAFFPIAEAAEQLGKNVKLVERLVEWCEAKDHAGVMGESNRLLSALIRHSKSKVSPGGNRSFIYETLKEDGKRKSLKVKVFLDLCKSPSYKELTSP